MNPYKLTHEEILLLSDSDLFWYNEDTATEQQKYQRGQIMRAMEFVRNNPKEADHLAKLSRNKF